MRNCLISIWLVTVVGAFNHTQLRYAGTQPQPSRSTRRMKSIATGFQVINTGIGAINSFSGFFKDPGLDTFGGVLSSVGSIVGMMGPVGAVIGGAISFVGSMFSMYGKRRRRRYWTLKMLWDSQENFLKEMVKGFKKFDAKLNEISGKANMINAKLDYITDEHEKNMKLMTVHMVYIHDSLVGVKSSIGTIKEKMSNFHLQSKMERYETILARYDQVMDFARGAASITAEDDGIADRTDQMTRFEAATKAFYDDYGHQDSEKHGFFAETEVRSVLESALNTGQARKCRAARVIQDILGSSFVFYQLIYSKVSAYPPCEDEDDEFCCRDDQEPCFTDMGFRVSQRLTSRTNMLLALSNQYGLTDLVFEDDGALLYLEAREYRLSRWRYPNGFDCDRDVTPRGQNDLAHWRPDLESKFFTLLNTNCNLSNNTMLDEDKQRWYQYFDPEWYTSGLVDKGRKDNSCFAYVNKRLRTNTAVRVQDHYVWSRSKCWE